MPTYIGNKYIVTPIAVKTPPPNNNPLNVIPVAMIASNAANSFFPVFIRLLCLLVTIHAAKVHNYFYIPNNLDYFFHLIFWVQIYLYIDAAPDYFLPYFCPNCKRTFHSL